MLTSCSHETPERYRPFIADIESGRSSDQGPRPPARRRGPLSLVELLVVVVILGIVVGIVVVAVGGLTEGSARSACRADRRTIVIAEEAYQGLNGAYADEAGLKAAHLIARRSRFYDVVVTQDGSGYEVEPQPGRDCPVDPPR